VLILKILCLLSLFYQWVSSNFSYIDHSSGLFGTRMSVFPLFHLPNLIFDVYQQEVIFQKTGGSMLRFWLLFSECWNFVRSVIILCQYFLNHVFLSDKTTHVSIFFKRNMKLIVIPYRLYVPSLKHFSSSILISEPWFIRV